MPGRAAYAAAKTAVETFTHHLAKELGPRGITANVLAPGAIETDFLGGAVRDEPQRSGERPRNGRGPPVKACDRGVRGEL